MISCCVDGDEYDLARGAESHHHFDGHSVRRFSSNLILPLACVPVALSLDHIPGCDAMVQVKNSQSFVRHLFVSVDRHNEPFITQELPNSPKNRIEHGLGQHT